MPVTSNLVPFFCIPQQKYCSLVQNCLHLVLLNSQVISSLLFISVRNCPPCTQCNYSVHTLKKELLFIIEILLEYHSMFLGYTIVAFTDHLNLTFNNNQSQCALHWCLIEEFGCTIHCVGDSSNHATDVLLPLKIMEPDAAPLYLRREQSHFEDSYMFYPVQHSQS